MSDITAFLESGLLELYVMGAASPDEATRVEQMAAAHPQVRAELDQISRTLESYAQAQAVAPKPAVKALLMATVDYIERMQQGEPASAPPELTESSRREDYALWLDRPDMQHAPEAAAIYARIIGYTPTATTAIIWVRDMTHFEVHHEEYERFLILEGACDLLVEDEVHPLKPGSFFAVPLHARHRVQVTSEVPCKAILQRLTV